MAELIVLGLDGVSWNLLDPWIEDGELENLEKIAKEGKRGFLKSTLPYVTFPAWRSMTSGKNPGKHGVFWWRNVDFSEDRIVFNNSSSFDTDDFWDSLNRNGITTGIINVPGTFPPKEVDGFMVSGAICDEKDEFTYPKSMKKELLKEGYRISNSTSFEENKEKAMKNIKESIRSKFEAIRNHSDEVDMVMATIFEVDNVQHFFWDGKETLEVWKLIDREVGKLMEEKEAEIIIASDHGFKPMSKKFYINELLKKKGYLTFKEDDEPEETSIISLEKMYGLAKRLKVLDLARKLVPEFLVQMLPREEKGVENIEEMVDWKNTRALATGEGPVYVKEDEDVEEIKEELERHPAVKNIVRKEEAYDGRYMEKAPSFMIIPEDDFEISGSLGEHEVVEDSDDWIANHRRNGIYALKGQRLESLEIPEDLEIYDIRTLVQKFFKVPVQGDVDGVLNVDNKEGLDSIDI